MQNNVSDHFFSKQPTRKEWTTAFARVLSTAVTSDAKQQRRRGWPQSDSD